MRGADDYLIKRFDKNELLARIQFGLRILELYLPWQSG
jgi:DNA-binding response OmpR family regulator